MNEIINNPDNPLWFIESGRAGLVEYSENNLAGDIFDLAETEIQRKRRDILNSIIAGAPAVAETVKGMKKTQRLRIVFSDEVRKKLADGTYRLMKRRDKNNIFKAVVVDANNKTRAIADLKWDVVMKGVDPTQLTSAMQGMAIQMQLKDISEQLEDMSQAMEAVLIGQHNDRLALYYSGEAIFREALATSDPDRRKQLTTSAIISLTEAISLLERTLIYDINDVCNKFNAKNNRFENIKSDKLQGKMLLINSAFQTIHKAISLKAAIYYREGEYGALTTVLTDYKDFLERSLGESNARILYLADPNEKSLDGTWNIRKNKLPERILQAKELLATPEAYMLELSKEEMK